MNKVLIVGRKLSYYDPFSVFGTLTESIEDASLVVFTGGADVSPHLYNENAHPTTYNDEQRDKQEELAFNKAVRLKKNIVGICRGAQFICVMNGGKLIQDANNHGHCNHPITTDDGREITVTGDHHQMQLPPDNAVPIAWAEPRLSTYYHGGPGIELNPEKEHDVVWYPNTNALGIQYHPEWMERQSEGLLYSQELIERFFSLPRI